MYYADYAFRPIQIGILFLNTNPLQTLGMRNCVQSVPAPDNRMREKTNIYYTQSRNQTRDASTKSTHITFTLRNQIYQAVQMDNVALPQKRERKYLDMLLDRRLTWAKHIKIKRNRLNLKAKQIL